MSTDTLQTSLIQTLSCEDWQNGFVEEQRNLALKALEKGQVIYFPQLPYHLYPSEMPLLTTRFSTEKRKNISYNPITNTLQGVQNTNFPEKQALQALLVRYSEHARLLIENLFPLYQPSLIWGRTSYRPLEVNTRPTSYRKDDKRLHVDAFPSSPNQGKRILRVFCNINPHGEDRVWRLGEPFEKVAERFLPPIKKPWGVASSLMKLLRLTKGRRSDYDYYMLQIHDAMKRDEAYQKNAEQMEMRFPPGSTWIVQSDQVSHAAMSGQYMMEQTFYLPAEAMQDPRLSPLRVLERKVGKGLVG